MVQKCPAKFKNLNLIQSFSEQGYATVQLMQQACMNDEWLRQRVLKLNYLTPPAVRKWYKNGEWVNDSLSYGYKIDKDGNVCFNQTIEKRVFIDFYKDFDLIDMDKTDAVIMSAVTNEQEKELLTNDEIEDINYDGDGRIIEIVNGEINGISDDLSDVTPITDYWCQLPYENEAEKKTYTTTEIIRGQEAKYDMNTTTLKDPNCNSAWYVGFNKSKNYYVRPDWLKDWRDSEIPSVARGQTFQATETGKLSSIDLKLDYTGTQNSDCGSPLYVQIWSTVKEDRVKTIWNTRTMQMEKQYVYNGSKRKYELVYEKVPVPDTVNTGIYKPLAQAVFNPSKMKAFEVVNIKFDNEVKLTKGQSYFIALFSPLSEWKHCPRWAGWGRNCYRDKKYEYGNAFLSEDNGRTWIRFGRNDTSVAYKFGKYVPQDFAFTCHIRTKDKIDTVTNTIIEVEEDTIDDAGIDNPRYLYLKPIYCNPLTSITISADDDGGNENKWVSDGIGIKYQYSVTGRDDDWHDATLNFTHNIYQYSDGTRPEVVHIRAKLYRNTTATVQEGGKTKQKYRKATPKIWSIGIILTTEPPKSMYVRTYEWQPRTDAMLGANIWGRVFAPFETEPTVNCKVEIVTNEKPTDHFTIIEVENVLDYCNKKVDKHKLEDTNYTSILKTTINSLEDKTNDEICEYLYGHPEVIDELKRYNIYVKPYEMTVDDIDFIYLLSFSHPDAMDTKVLADDEYQMGGLQFYNNVAFPILECIYTPEGSTTDVTGLSERYDFTFDYDNNVLTFRDGVLNQLTLGDIGVTYNKCFIDNLISDEVGIHVDTETGLKEQGLILDYFKETFNIDANNIETRRVKLRVDPVDPIREVVLNRDTDEEVELFEGFDYELDIDNNELVFNVANIDGISSILKEGDVLEVVYTPNLQATALSLGYWVTRENRDKQVRIKNGYWEYKA